MHHWPALPQGIKQGVCGQWGRQIYVGLGSAGQALYRLDLDQPQAGWQSCAMFPGAPREGAAFAMDAGKLVVMSGAGKIDATDASPVVLTDIHIYDAATDCWSQADSTIPVGLLGATAWAVGDGQVLCIGGYNKDLFDTFVAALAQIDPAAEPDRHRAFIAEYMGMMPQDYQWNDRVWLYDLGGDTWRDIGVKAGLPTTGAALLSKNLNALLVNGEIKPGLRSADVLALSFNDGAVSWADAPSLPALSDTDRPEGLAGAFAGYADGVAIVAGGVNFPGARDNAAVGRWYAHQGLTKVWHDTVYALCNGAWQSVGQLPQGLAYGASLSLPEGLLILGGEDGKMAASDRIVLLKWDHEGDRLVVEGAD